MITLLTLVIHGSLLVAFLAGGWLMWTGIPTDSRVDSMRRGTATQAPRRGEATTGLRSTHPVFDVQVTR